MQNMLIQLGGPVRSIEVFQTTYDLGSLQSQFEMGAYYNLTNKRTKQQAFMTAIKLPENGTDMTKCMANISTMQYIQHHNYIPANSVYRDGLEKYYLVSDFVGQGVTNLSNFVLERGMISEHDLGAISE